MSQRSVLRGLAMSCHPLPTAGVTALSAGLAALAGLGPGRGLLFTGAVLAGQLSIGWSNDWIDAARDKAAGRQDKPAADGAISPRTVMIAAITAFALATVLSLALGPAAGLAALILVVAGWLYNLGLKSTVLSWVPYACGFGALPAAATLARPAHLWPAWWAMAAAAVLGIAAHAANVLPDLKADKETGVAGLWHHLGARATAIAGPVLLVIASVLVLFGPGRPAVWKWIAVVAIAALAMSGLVIGLRRPASRALFAASIVLAGVDLTLFAVSGAKLY